MNKHTFKLGNTGFTLDIPKTAEEADPAMIGRRRRLTVSIPHHTEPNDNYTVSVELFSPILGRGPAFNWDWCESRVGGHTVRDVRTVEHALYATYNVGLQKNEVVLENKYLLCGGASLCYLAGTYQHNHRLRSTQYVNEGSIAVSPHKALIPIFEIADLRELRERGAEIITDDCYVINRGQMYRVNSNKIMDFYAHYMVKGEFQTTFLTCLRLIARKKFSAHELRRSTCEKVVAFLGHRGELINIRLSNKDAWRWCAKSTVGKNIFFFNYKGTQYVYTAQFEVNMSAEAAMIIHENPDSYR